MTIEIDPSQASGITVDAEGTVQLLVSVDPAGTELTYSSSNDEVATISGSGLITGVAEGTAVVTVSAGDDASATVDVTVNAI